MRVRVLLFGAVREAVGAKELDVQLDEGARVGDLRDWLGERHEVVARYGTRLAAARNQQTCGDETPLRDGDEVAFLPPVSGGCADAAGTCSLSDRPLDVGEVVSRVMGPDVGGLVTFVGAVRDHARGREIRHLEYEAYPPMAVAEMEKICVAARERWPDARVAIAHRHGHLGIGDLAVVVAAAAPHRGEAFEACRFAIDTLKETVPIWKKEVARDGEYWVDDRP
jgi:molybdopterin synthase catalytic subunit